MTDPETTQDLLLGGRLRLRQPARGHRAGTDAILLAAAAPPCEGLAIDAGSGAGAAGLAYGLRVPAARLLLLEIDPALAALAQDNIAANALDGRALALDLTDRRARLAAGVLNGSADLVLTNPPFLDASASRVSPDAARARAHAFAGPDGLALWIRSCLALLTPKGRFVMIHRADALPAVLAAVEGRLGGLTLRFVHARADAPAIRLLLAGTKGSRAPLAVAPPLVLHGAEGDFTELAGRIHRGEAGLGG